jgi:hypothetical protein|tara:strand:+ start:537 stop:980 length:444 start_codon:yes stop_codon:yes gene_type:complete
MDIIPKNRYLGKLCKRGHDWNDTGQSLKSIFNRGCIKCSNISVHNYYIRNKEKIKKKASIRGYKYRANLSQKQKDKNNAISMKYYYNHREMRLIKSRKYQKKAQNELADWYVARNGLIMSIKDAPLELINAKRETMKLQRLIRKGVI